MTQPKELLKATLSGVEGWYQLRENYMLRLRLAWLDLIQHDLVQSF